MGQHWRAPKPCERCGEPKPKGQGRRFCAGCTRYRRKPDLPIQPCRKCGGGKPRGKGRQLCDDCLENSRWREERLAAARGVVKREPCKGCGRPKGPGKSRIYCDACQERRSWRDCQRCQLPKIKRGSHHRHLCDDCQRERIEEERIYQREKKREYRQDPVKAERMRVNTVNWRERKRSTPRGVQELNEAARLGYMLRQQRAGREVRTVLPPPSDPMYRVTLPGGPLVAAVDRHLGARSEEDRDGRLEALCRDLGVYPRHFYGWRVGERGVTLAGADKVLTGLELAWWEVWNEQTVRLPLLVATSYAFRAKKGNGRLYRERRRQVRYGDRGPDLAELERITALMERRGSLATAA